MYYTWNSCWKSHLTVFQKQFYLLSWWLIYVILVNDCILGDLMENQFYFSNKTLFFLLPIIYWPLKTDSTVDGRLKDKFDNKKFHIWVEFFEEMITCFKDKNLKGKKSYKKWQTLFDGFVFLLLHFWQLQDFLLLGCPW